MVYGLCGVALFAVFDWLVVLGIVCFLRLLLVLWV